MSTQNFAYNREDFDVMEQELEQVEAEILSNEQSHKILRMQIDQGLENAMQELQELKDKLPKEQGEKLFDQCTQNALNAITGHFGLAAVVLDSQDGGNVTTSQNFEKGIVANERDRAKLEEYNKGYSRDGYDKTKDNIRNTSPQIITSEYTGKQLERGSGVGKGQLDHVVSVKEFDREPDSHLFLSKEQREQIINNEKNLKWLSHEANASKGDRDLMEWGNDIDPTTGQTNFEKYNIDSKQAQEIYDEAKKSINTPKTIAKVKQYTKDVLKTGAQDAAKMAAYSAIGVILRDFIKGMMIELKILFKEFGNESLKEIFTRFKTRLEKIWSELKVKWKDIIAGSFEAGIVAFFSNLVVFVINIVFTTLKKFVQIIRAGFTSLYQAIKIIVNPPKDMPKDEVMTEAAKVFVAGVISAVAMLGSEAIKTWLMAIPGLNVILAFPIPLLNETIGDALSLCISAAMGAVLSTIAIYYIDKYASQSKEDRLQIQIMTKSGEIVQYKIAQTYFVLHDAWNYFGRAVEDTKRTLEHTATSIMQASSATKESLNELDEAMNRLKAFQYGQDIKQIRD